MPKNVPFFEAHTVFRFFLAMVLSDQARMHVKLGPTRPVEIWKKTHLQNRKNSICKTVGTDFQNTFFLDFTVLQMLLFKIFVG